LTNFQTLGPSATFGARSTISFCFVWICIFNLLIKKIHPFGLFHTKDLEIHPLRFLQKSVFLTFRLLLAAGKVAGIGDPTS